MATVPPSTPEIAEGMAIFFGLTHQPSGWPPHLPSREMATTPQNAMMALPDCSQQHTILG